MKHQIFSNHTNFNIFYLQVGRANDFEWLTSLCSSAVLKKNAHFSQPKISAPAFIVRHFAANVKYEVDGFIEKNLDVLSEQLKNTIASSKVISRLIKI